MGVGKRMRCIRVGDQHGQTTVSDLEWHLLGGIGGEINRQGVAGFGKQGNALVQTASGSPDDLVFRADRGLHQRSAVWLSFAVSAGFCQVRRR